MRRTVIAGLVAFAITGSTGAFAQSEFSATMGGDQEVPPVVTDGFGLATFDVNIAGGVVGVNYSLTVNNVRQAFMAHIHCGAAGTNGPIAVWLAGRAAAPANVGYDLNGPWIGSAKFTEANIVAGNGCGDDIGSLLNAMAAGRTYVNVHTVPNGGGEIRGQIAQVAPLSLP
ncbi:MAG: CHRD domain-containing protein [Ectothiorhodospiraceae bacterium]|nr:CHRD domain-containing protein [Ectothiorhodospiraceae bacterium]